MRFNSQQATLEGKRNRSLKMKCPPVILMDAIGETPLRHGLRISSMSWSAQGWSEIISVAYNMQKHSCAKQSKLKRENHMNQHQVNNQWDQIGKTMSYTKLVFAFLFTAVVTVGCDSAEKYESKQRASAAGQLEKAKTETKEAAQSMQDYSYAKKDDFVDKTKKELGQIQEELDRLYAKVEKSNADVKADAKTKLDAVREKWAQAKKQLDQAESATESTWDDVKGDVKKSYGKMKDSYDQTRQWLSNKIEP